MAEKKKVPQTEVGKLKEKLKTERKLKREYKAKVEKAERIFEAIQPQIDAFENEHCSWTTLPVIPQDLGFREIEEKREGEPVMRIYVKDGCAMTKMMSGKWRVTIEEFQMDFRWMSKFDAYHSLKAIGVKFED